MKYKNTTANKFIHIEFCKNSVAGTIYKKIENKVIWLGVMGVFTKNRTMGAARYLKII